MGFLWHLMQLNFHIRTAHIFIMAYQQSFVYLDFNEIYKTSINFNTNDSVFVC